ncbi:hypothetical protein ACIRBX_19155 [Kitasatospora sp. NPDC096147]|uniref:hypothetical protein n=1 Tax=Kitasatospora sp. NPDC096147 TaxID=3364093 RepID=UPI00382301E3
MNLETLILEDGAAPVPLVDFEGGFSRWAYLQGAILIEIDGRTVLDSMESDTIDALWSLVIGDIAELLRSGRSLVRFPDRPYAVGLSLLQDGRIFIDVNGNSRTAALEVQAGAFLRLILKGACEFFGVASAKALTDESGYQRDLRSSLALLGEVEARWGA